MSYTRYPAPGTKIKYGTVIASCYFNDDEDSLLILNNTIPYYSLINVNAETGELISELSATNICELMSEYSELCGVSL